KDRLFDANGSLTGQFQKNRDGDAAGNAEGECVHGDQAWAMVSACATGWSGAFSGMGCRPSLANSCSSASGPGFGVVSRRSPRKIEFAPAMKHRAWVLSSMDSRPADRRTTALGMVMRATAIVRTN